jgi:hypothetical protein
VDVQKAFDSVWRDGLLYKLANIGIGKYFYSQNILSLLTLFWRPSLLSNIIRRTSANAREPTLKFKSSGGRHSSVLKLALRFLWVYL